MFQCSSASRKFLNRTIWTVGCGGRKRVSVLFSEPKIPQSVWEGIKCEYDRSFQCSSASRKFLNCAARPPRGAGAAAVSVLFSEPKIPQCSGAPDATIPPRRVSVLFSEPKIPQFGQVFYRPLFDIRFQCSSASRKFLNSCRALGGFQRR